MGPTGNHRSTLRVERERRRSAAKRAWPERRIPAERGCGRSTRSVERCLIRVDPRHPCPWLLFGLHHLHAPPPRPARAAPPSPEDRRHVGDPAAVRRAAATSTGPASRAHVARTAAAGLVPAVNMDTGYVNLLTRRRPGARCSTRPARPCGGRAVRRRGVRRRPPGGERSTPTPTAGRSARSSSAGGTPVIFQSYGLTALADERAGRRLPRRSAGTATVHRVRAGHDVRPVRQDLLARHVPRACSAMPTCIGAKHSSLRPRAGVAAAAAPRRGAARTSRCFTGNDLAIDMVMYGSDYLLGLSTFAPDLFAQRDALWQAGDPRLLRAERRAPVPRLLRLPRRRCRRTSTRRPSS